MKRIAKQLSLWVLLVSFVSGCALGPNYKRPAVDAPGNYRSAITPVEQGSLADLPWWQIFKAETLQRLITEALQNNYDLRVAVTRVEQARQIAFQARGQFFPQINYDGIVAKGKDYGPTFEITGMVEKPPQGTAPGLVRRSRASRR